MEIASQRTKEERSSQDHVDEEVRFIYLITVLGNTCILRFSFLMLGHEFDLIDKQFFFNDDISWGYNMLHNCCVSCIPLCHSTQPPISPLSYMENILKHRLEYMIQEEKPVLACKCEFLNDLNVDSSTIVDFKYLCLVKKKTYFNLGNQCNFCKGDP